jgi:tetratricopeptide (TPR) repeat protein
MVLRLPDSLGDPRLLLVEEERQTLELDSTGQFQVVVRRVPCVGAGRRLPIQDPEVAPFLAPSLYTQADDPRLQELARQLRGGESDSWQVVCHIEEWVHDRMVPRDTNVHLKSALEVLDALEGTCSEYAALFISVCQAAGVPARACTGFVPAPTGELVLHIWAQVFVGRWVDVDPTWDQLAVDASHLKTSQGRLEPTGMARLNLPVQFLLARADTLELVEYEGDGDRFLGRAEALYAAAQEADRTFHEEQAQELYRRLLLLPWNQRSGDAQVEVGRFHLYRRQWPAASAAFAQILALDPDGPAAGQALFYLSRAAEDQGDTLQAQERLGELVRRFPDHELADDALGHLAELHERQEGCARAVPLYDRVREEYSRSGWAEVARVGLERCRKKEAQESGRQ